MRRETPADNHFDIEFLVAWILRLGLLTSVALLLVGLGWHWVRSGSIELDYSMGRMNLFRFVVAELHDLTHGRITPRALISSGITTLMLTPYARVLASMLYFGFAERNVKYTCLTGFVLGILTYTLFVGG